ncbi:MAG: hypothetical protein J5I90_20750 [Caldilineales bacterium]|nr:hypothetical protein [Caldilineales bacterium]
MSSDFSSYFRIIARRWWLLLLLPLVTAGVILALSRTTTSEYLASERLQIIVVDPQEVTLFSPTRLAASNEEIQAVHDEFYDVLRLRSVAWRTIADLGLNLSADELIERIDSQHLFDFITVTARMPTPQLAQQVAATHAANAINTYRNIRATPAQISLDFIESQLGDQTARLASAKEALQNFQLENEVSDLNREALAYQDLMRSLRSDRDAAMVEAERNDRLAEEYEKLADASLSRAEALQASLQVTETVPAGEAESVVVVETPTPNPFAESELANLITLEQAQRRTAADYSAAAAGFRAAVAELNRQLSRQQQQLVYLLGLQERYTELVTEVAQAQADYDFLAGKASEAELKLSQGKNIGYLQVIESAQLPEGALPKRTLQILLVGIVISLLVAIILAFVLEVLESSVSGRSTSQPAPARRP